MPHIHEDTRSPDLQSYMISFTSVDVLIGLLQFHSQECWIIETWNQIISSLGNVSVVYRRVACLLLSPDHRDPNHFCPIWVGSVASWQTGLTLCDTTRSRTTRPTGSNPEIKTESSIQISPTSFHLRRRTITHRRLQEACCFWTIRDSAVSSNSMWKLPGA